MTIEFRCTQCQGTLKAPAEMAGKKAKCRKCSAVVIVPQRPAAAPQQPTITSSAPVDSRWPPGMKPPAAPADTPRAVSKNPAPPLASSPPAAAPPARPTPLPPRSKPAAAADKVSPAQRPPAVVPPAVVAPRSRAVPLPPVPSIPVAPAVFPDEPIRDDIDELLDLELPVARADSPSPAQLNPYQSPSSDNNPQRVVRRGEIEITRVAYGDVMRTSWRIYKANLGAGLVVTIITMFCSGLLQSLVVALMPVLAVAARNLGLGEAAVFPIMGLSLLAQLFLLTFFLCGLISFSLDTARGRPTGVGAVFSAGPHLVSGAGVLLVALCGVVAGAFLLVVPSLICAILLALAPVVLVDRDEGMLPSLTLSARVMLKNFLPAFLLLISVGIVSNLITLITCGLGILLVAPFQLFLLVTLYLRATGQRTAYD